MFSKRKISVLYIAAISFCFIYSCKNNEPPSRYEAIEFSKKINKHYLIGGSAFTQTNILLLEDYNIISPVLPSTNKEVLVEKYKDGLGMYDINNNEIHNVDFEQRIDFYQIQETYYFNRKIILLEEDNTLCVFIENNNRWTMDYKTKISDPEVFNIYGGIKSDTVIIEAGYFPSGGCEYIKYYSLDLQQYKLIECTKKILPINNPQSPFDIFYMDIDQNHLFFPNQILEGISWNQSDDYILNFNLDTVGRALQKQINYNGYGFSLNNENEIDYYFWKNGMDKVICFPVNYNFEKQIFRTYYDSLLVESDLMGFSKFEIELLKNTIIRKNNGIISSERIKNVLSVYAFYFDYQESTPIDKINLQGNEKRNFAVLKGLI